MAQNSPRDPKTGQFITKEQYQEQEEVRNELNETINVYDELISKADEMSFVNRNINDSFREMIEVVAKSSQSTAKAYRSIATEQNNAIENSKRLITSYEIDSKKIDKQILNNAVAIGNLERELPRLNKTQTKVFNEMIKSLKEANENLEDYQTLISKTPQFGIIENLNNFVKDIPIIGKTLSNIVTPFKTGMDNAFKSGKFGADAFAATLKHVGKVGLLALLELLIQVNQQITDIQKNFGVSAGKAQVLRAEISTAAARSGDLFITTEKLLASFTALSAELGFQVTTSGQLLETFTNLEQRFGFSSTEAANLTSILGLTNKNSEDLLGNTIKTINRSRDSNKLFNNTKLILKDVADASAGTVIALGRSPDLLAKAAVKARELGISLGQVEKIADSLLNFESSIEAELKAELLTGKQLNLERARFLALNNDLIGLQEELNKQNINFAEYTQMSRIGQQALAESLGMGREEMSQMLFNQEKQLLAQKATRGELEGQTLAQFKALSAQQKFEASVEKVKNLFSSIVSFLSPFIDFAAKIADILAKITGFFQIGGDILSAGVGRSIEARAMGGPVSSGSPYIVGEKGPELFVPGSSGQIVNNSALSNMSSPSINFQPLVERLDRLEKTLVEYRSVPVVIENRLDGDAFLRNTLRGNRRGNPAIVVPSVYTGGLT
jgi:hypothetical protein